MRLRKIFQQRRSSLSLLLKNFSDELSRQMYHDFLRDEINVVLPGGAENLRMLDQRILPSLEKIMHAVTDSGHTLLVGHRNVNKMIVKNLLGLTIEKGYRVEHENNWLYIYALQRKEIFHIMIGAPHLPIEVAPGYREIVSFPSCNPVINLLLISSLFARS